jgi:hypothetical protein
MPRLPAGSIRHPYAVLLALLALVAAACDHYAAAGAAQTPRLTPVAMEPPAGEADPCARIGVGDPQAIVEPVMAGTGCLPPQQVVVFRCDYALDPVALLDAGGVPRRFLGGSFAVPVPVLPEGSIPLGVTAGGRLHVVPSDPRFLFLESGGRIERWLALPEPTHVSAPPGVIMVGDSILDGAVEAVTAGLPEWELTIDAEVGRGSYGAATIIEELPLPPPDAVVIEIGVNDHDGGTFRANAERMVTASEGVELIVWVTPHGPDTDTEYVNEALLDVAGRSPVSTLADWDSLVPQDELSSDGVHLSGGNEQVFADILVPVLEGWRVAAAGGGAARCGNHVIAAISG